jgi:preprotein translocase subunit SecG
MTSTLLIVQLVLTVLVVIAVLLQKSSSMGLGAYSGSNDTMFGAKGPASLLVKITFVLGAAFVINTIALGYLYNAERQKSVVDTVNANSLVPQAPKVSIPSQAPAAPVSAIDSNISAVPTAIPQAPATK